MLKMKCAKEQSANIGGLSGRLIAWYTKLHEDENIWSSTKFLQTLHKYYAHSFGRSNTTALVMCVNHYGLPWCSETGKNLPHWMSSAQTSQGMGSNVDCSRGLEITRNDIDLKLSCATRGKNIEFSFNVLYNRDRTALPVHFICWTSAVSIYIIFIVVAVKHAIILNKERVVPDLVSK